MASEFGSRGRDHVTLIVKEGEVIIDLFGLRKWAVFPHSVNHCLPSRPRVIWEY